VSDADAKDATSDDLTPRFTRRQIIAGGLTGAAGLFAAAFPPLVLEPPMVRERDASTSRSKRAAIGLRDHEIPFFKQGTKLYTLPNLQRHYNEVAYFTQDDLWWKQLHVVTPHLRRLLETHEVVDIWLLVHGRKAWWQWLEALPPELCQKVRLVYSTGCADASDETTLEWLQLGATSYVSHPGQISASPFFYFYFLRHWLRGESLQDAVAHANDRIEPILKSLPESPRLHPERLWLDTRAELFGARDIWLGSSIPTKSDAMKGEG
jgi:hypothetical protein